MYYVQEIDKPTIINSIFKRIELFDDTIVLPVAIDNKKLNKRNKQLSKFAEKTAKLLNTTNSRKVVLSKRLKGQEIFVNKLYSYNIDIVHGEGLLEVIIQNILEYIIENRN